MAQKPLGGTGQGLRKSLPPAIIQSNTGKIPHLILPLLKFRESLLRLWIIFILNLFVNEITSELLKRNLPFLVKNNMQLNRKCPKILLFQICDSLCFHPYKKAALEKKGKLGHVHLVHNTTSEIQKTLHYVGGHEAFRAWTTFYKQERMAGGSSRGPFSFSLMLLLLLWDSHPCLWDFSIIIGTALFQFWKIIYSFLRHPKLCLGSGRHRFKTIGSQGGLSNRRLTEQLHGWCWHWTCWVPWCWEGSTRGEVVEQSGAEGLKAPEFHLQGPGSCTVCCESELALAVWGGKPQILRSLRDEQRDCEMKKVPEEGSGKLSLSLLCLVSKHILEAAPWMMSWMLYSLT